MGSFTYKNSESAIRDFSPQNTADCMCVAFFEISLFIKITLYIVCIKCVLIQVSPSPAPTIHPVKQ